MSKSLPVEVEICNVVKEIMIKYELFYIKKYCEKQIENGVKTGKRNHKFWGVQGEVRRNWREYCPIIDEMNNIVKNIDSSYIVELDEHYTNFGGSIKSIKIRAK